MIRLSHVFYFFCFLDDDLFCTQMEHVKKLHPIILLYKSLYFTRRKLTLSQNVFSNHLLLQ